MVELHLHYWKYHCLSTLFVQSIVQCPGLVVSFDHWWSLLIMWPLCWSHEYLCWSCDVFAHSSTTTSFFSVLDNLLEQLVCVTSVVFRLHITTCSGEVSSVCISRPFKLFQGWCQSQWGLHLFWPGQRHTVLLWSPCCQLWGSGGRIGRVHSAAWKYVGPLKFYFSKGVYT